MKKTIEIPEGYEAKIEGNKVILEPKESEDEIIRNKLIVYLKQDIEEYPERKERIEDMLAWVKKQGEKNEHTKHPDMVANLKEYLANTPKEQIEKDWDELKCRNNVGPTVEEFLYGERRVPAKWGDHDNMILDSAIEILNSFGYTYETTLKGLRLIKSSLQPQWKPSDEQMQAFKKYLNEGDKTLTLGESILLRHLYKNLKKLKG